MLVFSDKISNLVTSKQDCFKQIRQLAFFSVGGQFNKCFAFAEALKKSSLLDADMTWARTRRGAGMVNLVFLGDENVTYKKIESLRPKIVKKMPTPPCVLVKMVASRLFKLHEVIEGENAYRMSATHNRHPQIPLPQREDMENRFNLYVGNTMPYIVRYPATEAGKIIERGDMNSEIIQKAWDLYEVKKVMSS